MMRSSGSGCIIFPTARGRLRRALPERSATRAGPARLPASALGEAPLPMSTDTAAAGGKGRLTCCTARPSSRSTWPAAGHLGRRELIAVGTCILLHYAWAFGLTAGYHRYFAHKSYKTGRAFQFLLAVLGASAAQMGPPGGPATTGSTTGTWTPTQTSTSSRQGFCGPHGLDRQRPLPAHKRGGDQDFARFPELRWLDRFHWGPPLLLAAGLYGLGAWLGAARPELGTSGLQLLTWGFSSAPCSCTGTFFVTSLAHTWGTRGSTPATPAATTCSSLCSPSARAGTTTTGTPPERQGFYWWELDPTHYLLKLFARAGLVRELAVPPPAARRGRARR